MLPFLLLVNLIYFIIGYIDGAIDFTKPYQSSLKDGFYGVATILAIVILIIWIVFYFRNNSFKEYYVKSKNAIFYEWIQILIIVILLFAYSFFIELGKETRYKGYIKETILKERCDIIAKANFFIDAPFDSADIDTANSVKSVESSKNEVQFDSVVYKPYVTILNKKYNPAALINRYSTSIAFSDNVKDSLRTQEIRRILKNNKKEEVSKIIKSFFEIIKEHNLKTNLTANKLVSLNYHYPDFSKFLLIKTYYGEEEDYSKYVMEEDMDIENLTNKKYSKYYVELKTLEENYKTIADTFETPIYENKYGIFTMLLCLSLGFSIVLLTFRLFSGRNWLISTILFILLNIPFWSCLCFKPVFIYEDDYTYGILVIVSSLVFITLFINNYLEKIKNRFSDIILNLCIYFSIMFLPTIYFLLLEYYRNKKLFDNQDKLIEHHFYVFLRENLIIASQIYLLIFIGIIFLYSRIIRNWKGFPEK